MLIRVREDVYMYIQHSAKFVAFMYDFMIDF